MGWLFTYGQTRQQLIERLTQEETTEGGVQRRCLKHALRGNVLWAVWEITRPDGSMWRYIGCDLLQRERNYGWGYKPLCESDGPAYYSCPLAYLDLAPEANAQWRAAVREYHASRNRKIPVGSVVSFQGLSIPQAVIVESKGRTLVGEYAGMRYRIPPRIKEHITDVRMPGHAR